MDRVVDQVGKRNNCTYCGVFRRQALDRGAAGLDVDHIVTGHNADDIAETVLMNSELTVTNLVQHLHTAYISPSWRRCPSAAMHGRHDPVGTHHQALQAVQICVREGDCHVSYGV
jgi:cytoplasmic tRNA 2-thiolation protein 1